jgi:hypothetical protein
VYRAAILEGDDPQPTAKSGHPSPVAHAPVRLPLRPERGGQHRRDVIVLYRCPSRFWNGSPHSSGYARRAAAADALLRRPARTSPMRTWG